MIDLRFFRQEKYFCVFLSGKIYNYFLVHEFLCYRFWNLIKFPSFDGSKIIFRVFCIPFWTYGFVSQVEPEICFSFFRRYRILSFLLVLYYVALKRHPRVHIENRLNGETYVLLIWLFSCVLVLLCFRVDLTFRLFPFQSPHTKSANGSISKCTDMNNVDLCLSL